jgi:hypothetical protein
MKNMSTRRTGPAPLPFVASAPLVDHHCHGVLASGGELEALLNEADGSAAAGGMAFDSLAGLAFRRWCPPMLGLPAHASVAEYEGRRNELGWPEVNQRFMSAAGLKALLVDTGYAPAALLSPAETADLAGAEATGYEIVRLEQVAESLAWLRPTEFATRWPGSSRSRPTAWGSG